MTADELSGPIDIGEIESGSIELKERLSRDTHLDDGKRESLAAQMRHRLLSGDGLATYVVGVTDDESVAGIPEDAFVETTEILEELAEDVGARVDGVQTWKTDRGLVGTVTITDHEEGLVDDDHIVVGTAGHVDHGKSTLVGTLITGEPDDGDGGMRQYLDVQPHEVERGLSADLSFAVYGFNYDDATSIESSQNEHIGYTPVRLGNPSRDSDRAKLVEEADRIISFVDTVGHEPWLRTTIRGLVGQQIDYGLLSVAADDGPTKTTREHLGIMLATDIPVIVAITKADMVSDGRVEEVKGEVERLLRDVGKTPLDVDRAGVADAVQEASTNVVPVFVTSSITRRGTNQLDEFFANVEKKTSNGGPLRMYIDRVYQITGVGPVVSGTIKSGTLSTGDSVQLGPFPDGSYRDVEVRSIEMHYSRVDEASSGHIVGAALKGVETDEIERGMALLPPGEELPAVREFKAETTVLNHPTSITDGYEPVIHCETISESVTFHPYGGQLLPGNSGPVRVEFKFRPYFLEEGQTFVFREGQSKGVGTIQKVYDDG